MPDRIELSPELRDALLTPDLLPEFITVRHERYNVHAPIAAGFKGAVWKVTDDYGRVRAAKIAICADYEDRSFLQELSRATALEPYPEFAKFIAADVIGVKLGDMPEQPFVCFIEEWVDGTTLDKYLERHPERATSSLLLGYVKGMATALAALEYKGLRHDDLHAGNVMMASPPPGLTDDRWTIKVIDTGSLKPRDQTKKAKNDHLHFIEHLIIIHNAMLRNRLLPARERRFLSECKRLIRSMLDEDPSTALTRPDQIREQFEYAYARANFPRAEKPTLQSPFEYISAEHIADDRLLVEVFADSCPWLDKVAGPDPCLVAGPRGCGKSTMFRWLSLKTHLHKDDPGVDRFRIAGFYLSCSSDLQNRFGWINSNVLATKFEQEIVHYFNLMLVREVALTLSLICERTDRESFWGIGEMQERLIYDFLRKILGTRQPVLQGVSRLRQAIEMIEASLFDCHMSMLRGINLETTTPQTLLGDFTSFLAAEVPFFASKRIAFLLDDFSTHRLPEPVQVVLNRIIWERRGSHIFKLSSEKYGAALTDSFHATVDVTREMIEVDCGREYVALDDSDQQAKALRFAKELLANRLRVAGYAGTPDNILGPSSWSEGSLGKALRDKPEGRKNDQYHGLECIATLCSGDVSTLLLVYRRIFEKGGVGKSTTDTVPKHVQHEAIESVSRELFDAIRNHFPHGKDMHWIVSEFGRLVRRILQEGRLIKQGDSRVPAQCPRIEVDQNESATDEGLNDKQSALARELVRRAVFIEMEPGRSRHRFVPTLRWQLRRVYLPAFGAALSKNDAVKWKPAQFKYFLTDPSGACDMEWSKRPRRDPAAAAQLGMDLDNADRGGTGH